MKKTLASIAFVVLVAAPLGADDRDDVLPFLESQHARYSDVAMKIWDWAEVGYQEEKSSELLRSQLEEAGFEIELGTEKMPTAFVASYGSGKPVIAILAEFDALPGINQDAVPERKPIEGKAAGHACGHHLFGSGSTAAAEAVRRWLEASGTSGTIRLYGTHLPRRAVRARSTWHEAGCSTMSTPCCIGTPRR